MKATPYFLASMALVIASCCDPRESGRFSASASDRGDQEFSELKSPVILIGKAEDPFGWKITVKDSTGRVVSFGNLQIISSSIGASRHIGDTLK